MSTEKTHQDEDFYERVASDLVRALRGRRSCAEASRRLGYRSNVVRRWEAGESWPTASGLLRAHRRLRPREPSWLQRFFPVLPEWARGLDPESPVLVAELLTRLKGKTSILVVARETGHNRFSVSRWLQGAAEPRLPDFLRLVDVMSRRLVDFVAALVDPTALPSLADRARDEELARMAAYQMPWSHAVLRALELDGCPRRPREQRTWIASRLGLEVERVDAALQLLLATGQVTRTRAGRYVLEHVRSIDTSRDPARARALKGSWTATALERLQQGSEGYFGYSLFAVSKVDLERLRELQLQYVRAMQDIIAHSEPNECVALFCVQLLDLGSGPSR